MRLNSNYFFNNYYYRTLSERLTCILILINWTDDAEAVKLINPNGINWNSLSRHSLNLPKKKIIRIEISLIGVRSYNLILP